MKILLIACSVRACENMDWMSSVLEKKDRYKVSTIVKAKSVATRFDKRSLYEILKSEFQNNDAIVFLSATGIAVRAIAPFVKSKTTDPAVIVLDEEMKYAISLLSGHLGGANELANEIATMSGAMPIITTATDVLGEFSVDDFARKNSLVIKDMELAKEASVAIIEGKSIGFLSDIPLKYLKDAPAVSKDADFGVLITHNTDKRVFDKQLTLYPRDLYVGIGMKKGVKASKVKEFIDRVFAEYNLSTASIKCLATIDIKKDEPGLRKYASVNRLKIKTYSAKELRNVDGKYSSSDFVKSVTGVDNVCERAAMKAIKANGKLIVKKVKGEGITLAVAIKKR